MATSKSASKGSKKKPIESEDSLLSKLVHLDGLQYILDTETTGLMARGEDPDRLLEIGVVEIEDRKLTGRRFHAYINPQRPSNPEALAVHGLSETFLKDKPTFAQVYPALLEFVKDGKIVIHNAPFDLGFLDAEAERLGQPLFTSRGNQIIDTLTIAKEVWQGKRNNLDALCDRLAVNRSGRKLHGALLDAEILAEVYLQMGKGQNDLLLAGGATSEEIKQTKIAASTPTNIGDLEIIVLAPTAEELAEHNAYMADIDKGNKSLSIWSKFDRGLNPLEAYGLDGMPVVKAPPPPPPPEKKPEDLTPSGLAGMKAPEITF